MDFNFDVLFSRFVVSFQVRKVFRAKFELVCLDRMMVAFLIEDENHLPLNFSFFPVPTNPGEKQS
jgi:hypothetical protein